MPQQASLREFQGEIRVAARIIDYLSSGLYASLAACLKELVNNSYDADAKRVRIFVMPDADRIIIEDDGIGMNRAEFEEHFSLIAESHKRDKSDVSDGGRPKIGRIGIGAIAANEICEEMEVFSTKAGSTELLHVTVDFNKMRESYVNRRREGTTAVKGDYYGELLQESKPTHFTKIFLKEVRGEARQILATAKPIPPATSSRSIYGRKPESVFKLLQDPSVKSWSDFDSYSQNYLQVGLNVPIGYFDGWMSNRYEQKITDLVTKVESLGFRVYWDGTEVFKPVVFRARQGLIHRFEFHGEHVSAGGYFFAQHTSMKPEDLNGLLIRIRQAAVGGYDPSFMEFPHGLASLIQRWVSAEIWASDELEDAMNIDRRTLRVAHPAYQELKSAVHIEFEKFLSEARRQLYGSQAEARKRERASQQADVMQEVIQSSRSTLGSETAQKLLRAWSPRQDDAQGTNRLLRKYTVAEIYKMVLEVAEEVLEPRELKRFVEALTKRLRG